ncbi:MAG: malectin [Candidatus Sumerlaeia bacterium]|nr:malectin [Candidatus Sumerlaeia bacterium]
MNDNVRARGALTAMAAIAVMVAYLAACGPTIPHKDRTPPSLFGTAKAKFALRVNAGITEDYTDKAGNVWKGGKTYAKGGGYGFVEGRTVDRGAEMKIAGTSDARIYQTEHYMMKSFVAEVPKGKYTVRLHFAETYSGVTQPGQRVFDVAIQGKVVLPDFDVVKEAGAVQKAVVKEFKGIDAGEGTIEITFTPKTQNPEINGIEILGE